MRSRWSPQWTVPTAQKGRRPIRRRGAQPSSTRWTPDAYSDSKVATTTRQSGPERRSKTRHRRRSSSSSSMTVSRADRMRAELGWDLPLRYRRGAKQRLRGIDVYHGNLRASTSRPGASVVQPPCSRTKSLMTAGREAARAAAHRSRRRRRRRTRDGRILRPRGQSSSLRPDSTEQCSRELPS